MKRVAYFDNMKFILIVLVVIGHFIDQYTDNSRLFKAMYLLIYTFHMPLFLFLSGLFDKRGEPLADKAMKGIYYISLSVLLKCLISLTRFIMTGKWSFQLLSESGIPWFCFALGVFIILTGVLARIKIKLYAVIAVNIIIACFTGLDKSIGDLLCLSRIIVFYPFFLLGTMINKESIQRIPAKRAVRILSFVFLLALCVFAYLYLDKVYVMRHIFTGRNPFNASVRSQGPLLRLACYAVTAVIGFAFMMIVPAGRLKILTCFGERTLQVYFWHRPVLYVLTYSGIHTRICSAGVPGKLCWVLLAVLVACVFSLKCFGFPVKQLKTWLISPETKELRT